MYEEPTQVCVKSLGEFITEVYNTIHRYNKKEIYNLREVIYYLDEIQEKIQKTRLKLTQVQDSDFNFYLNLREIEALTFEYNYWRFKSFNIYS